MAGRLHDPNHLTDWLELDAHQRPRWLQRSRWLLYVVVAVVVGGGVALWGYLSSNRIYQAGPVSLKHQMFEQNCQVCHEESFTTLQRLNPGKRNLRSVPDSACLKCHDGDRHQPESVMAENHSCVSCHREHHGHDQLARVSTSMCLSCHRDLKRVTTAGHGKGYQNVASWTEHPEFERRWQGAETNTDPATLRFNHPAHLAPAGIPEFHDLSSTRPQQDGARGFPLREMQCFDCHQTDAAGEYMMPVTYDRHCKNCHPLRIPFTLATNDNGARQRIARFASKPAPHLDPLIVRGTLRQRLLTFVTNPINLDVLTLSEQPPRDPTRPKLLDLEKEFQWPKPRFGNSAQERFVATHLDNMERQLFRRGGDGGCKYCHRPTPKGIEQNLPKYEPSRINERYFPSLQTTESTWFPNARFDHKSHRMMDCRGCHANIDAEIESSKVHMPKIETCKKCHTDERESAARTDCVECHTYHPTKKRHEFRGRWTIDQLLEGTVSSRD